MAHLILIPIITTLTLTGIFWLITRIIHYPR